MKALLVLGIALLAAPSGPPVADAAMRGDLELVRQLLAEGHDVNAPQGDGMTALHWAAERGDAELTSLLLGAGADDAALTRLGDYTPLHLASKAGQASTVALLLQAGSDPMARTSTGGATPLHFAAASGNTAVLEALLDRGADVDVRESSIGQTALIFAVAHNRLDAVQLLLDRGADPGVTTSRSDPARDNAVARAAHKARDAVLASFREGLEARAGYTPQEVQAAVLAARRAVPAETDAAEEKEVEEEIDLDKVSIGRVGDYGGLTPLLHACRDGHQEIAVALLGAGAGIEQTGTGDGMSPLLMAIENGHFDLAMLLLERGADPGFTSNSGNSPLYATLEAQWAAKSTARPRERSYEQQRTTYRELLETLLRDGVDPNVRLKTAPPYEPRASSSVNLSGATPFWRAAYAVDVDAMRLLVSYGADPTLGTTGRPAVRRESGPVSRGAEVGSGVPPIHAASGVGYGQGFAAHSHRHVPDGWMPAIRYLVDELGHDVNARDANGYTPLHHAASRGDNEMVLYLVEHGADVTALSSRRQTTADMANQPTSRLQIFPETRSLLMLLGSKLSSEPKR